jgi:hypothetical protein
MVPQSPPEHPVLRSLAVMRAARDFGLTAQEADALARRFAAAPGSVEALAEAAAAALHDGRWARAG